ncbi:hypothetical protein CHS0354_014830, partial [Potamilus streckersoni]
GKTLHTIQPKVNWDVDISIKLSLRELRTINRLKTGKTLLKSSHGTNANSNFPACQVLETLLYVFNDCPTYTT